uniref:Reverse transcriptase zinc-binding domain-containing protein n=1 Tax=Hordeum vulgare subsp. vulgare TaxID=112509 RepID=A0A8I6WTP3_HORVV
MHLDDPFCPLCNQNAEETDLHLLWDCVFAQDCWKSVIPNKKRGTSLYVKTLLAIEQLPNAFAKAIVILGCWTRIREMAKSSQEYSTQFSLGDSTSSKI